MANKRKTENKKSHDSVDPFEEVKSTGVRGKISGWHEYGGREYGDYEYGESNPASGIYQQRRKRESYLGPGEKETGPPHTIKKENYWPDNPQTVDQQAWRAIHADGVHAWQALTNEQKAKLDEEAAELNMSGFNLSVSRYLNSHK